MIISWADSRSRRFYEEGKISKFRSLDIDAADELLAALDAATALRDLSPLKSVGLHKLTGARAGQWAMTVNGPWRICFGLKTETLTMVKLLITIRGTHYESHSSWTYFKT